MSRRNGARRRRSYGRRLHEVRERRDQAPLGWYVEPDQPVTEWAGRHARRQISDGQEGTGV
ncbi:MAG TPA: hypothetical protein VMP67_05145 [Candidatus Limnocylindria bacterium]|nr:hypothetical protein [Candidatus Limnocylindria bacterium]